VEKVPEKHWYTMPEEAVTDALQYDLEQGLDELEAARRRDKFGPNTLAVRKGQSVFVRFLLQFHQPLVYILLAAAVITAALNEWVDSIVIFGVVIINAIIGFVQESKAVKAIEALARSMTSDATVLRGGVKKRIPASELVPGDVVLLQSGDKIPADLRLLRSRELQIDESALTGESVPVEKHTDPLALDTMLADRNNMAYSSTLVTYGTGVGVVTAIGEHTEIGRINDLIANADILDTPLTKRIAYFSRVLLYVIMSMAILTFAVGIVRGESWLEMFMASVSLAVGAIPEGLPAALTITLAIGVSKMAKRHAIIRKLPAVETLGSTTVICSDKTGTLTQNEMTVEQVFAGETLVLVSGAGYAPAGDFSMENGSKFAPADHVALMECLKAGALCNDARLHKPGEAWKIDGDPTEGALLAVAGKAGILSQSLQVQCPRIDAIPFESEYQYMATLHGGAQNNAHVVYLKGSVESILPKCIDRLANSGEIRPLDQDEIHRRVDAMAAKGLRVLAVARRIMPPDTKTIDHSDVSGELTFLGLQAMIDPPRPEAIASVHACQRAGIEVKMITGDHAGTAMAIAREIGLGRRTDPQANPAVLTGRELSVLSDSEMMQRTRDTSVFARVAPEQKLRLVKALQARGNIVAMTGDGVNDGPALRQADIGVAMGITGTEVAKEAADMVLTDDNFSSIEAAVEEGRSVYENLIKFITWTLPTNLGEGLVIFAAIILGQTLPILPIQILWINMTTAVLLGLMLAFEPKEPGIMSQPPRDPASPILSKELLQRIVLVGCLLLAGSFGMFEYEMFQGESEHKARTVAVNVFVFGEIFYLLNCRSLRYSMFHLGIFSNPWIWFGIGIMTTLQLLFTHLPAMNRLFSSEPIGVIEWAAVCATGCIIYATVGFEKYLRTRGAAATGGFSENTQIST